MLTFFAIPKPFKGRIDIIQRNAIQSWIQLRPSCEIILFGDDEGTANLAREFGTRHYPDVVRNENGTPLLNDIFKKAQQAAAHKLLCYVNADIILLSDFLNAVQRVRFSHFLMVGQRWDVDFNQAINFNLPDWEPAMRRLAYAAVLHPPTGIDYFVFPRGLWGEIPPFAIGRTAWDNWLIYGARSRRAPVVDATQSATAIHQNHDYGHLPLGKNEAWNGPEAFRNQELAGGYKKFFTLLDATWKLTDQSLERLQTPEHQKRRRETFPLLHPYLYAAQEAGRQLFLMLQRALNASAAIMRKLIKAILRSLGYELKRAGNSTHQTSSPAYKHEYIDCHVTVALAKQEKLSVCDYVEKIWDQQGAAQRVIDTMDTAIHVRSLQTMCEIGPGPGRYMEKILSLCPGTEYVFYETSDDWSEWLALTYPAQRRAADGRSLQHEPDESMDLIHAHGVFTYLPALTTIEYFLEMVRVCKKGGWIVFDFFAEDSIRGDHLATWLASPERYPVILPLSYVEAFFVEKGFRKDSQFQNRYGCSFSTYHIYIKL